ncbi:MAG: GMP synthase subunit A [Candidatus Methanoplasma sp.]|jgi:GMP synthase (glutamine-hydrolysing)|nr:GMP synthase subunit A [Candidatus Methanoplasma sp.]
MKVYVVDNGGQWTHREWRVLKYLKVETKIVPNTTPFSELADLDGLVMSGGAPDGASGSDAMGRNGEYLDKAEYPVLGICAGMQFMSEHFGGTVGPGESPEYGRVALKVSDHGDLFRGLPSEFSVWASHNDEVKSVPPGFEVVASSASCPVEAIRSASKPLFGVQFHPEVEHTEHGLQIFQNFLDVVSEKRR